MLSAGLEVYSWLIGSLEAKRCMALDCGELWDQGRSRAEKSRATRDHWYICAGKARGWDQGGLSLGRSLGSRPMDCLYSSLPLRDFLWYLWYRMPDIVNKRTLKEEDSSVIEEMGVLYTSFYINVSRISILCFQLSVECIWLLILSTRAQHCDCGVGDPTDRCFGTRNFCLLDISLTIHTFYSGLLKKMSEHFLKSLLRREPG